MLCIPAFTGDYFLHLMNLCSIAVIGAVGINLLTGYCGQLSLGQASFLAIGAFTTAILSQRFGMPFFVAIPASCCAWSGGRLHRRPAGVALSRDLSGHHDLGDALRHHLCPHQLSGHCRPERFGRHHRSGAVAWGFHRSIRSAAGFMFC